MRLILIVAGLAAVAFAILLIVVAVDDRLFAPAIVIEEDIAAQIAVDVRGAVASPGVIELGAGSRVVDAIQAAGGVTADADLSTINEAARVHDGERIVIPTLERDAAEPGATPVAYLIDVNTASAAVLDTLPGIGETLSQRIVEYRDTNGPFESIDDLLEVEGISDSTLDEIRDLVTVGG